MELRKSPHLIVTDDKVAPHYLSRVEEQLKSEGYTVISHIVPSGESSKSLQVYEEVMTTAINGKLDRARQCLRWVEALLVIWPDSSRQRICAA